MWRFRHTLDVREVAGGLFVLGGRTPQFYEDGPVVQVARLVNGRRSVRQIAGKLADVVDEAGVMAAMRRLFRDGHLVREPVPDTASGLYIEGLGIRTDDVGGALGALRVHVLAWSTPELADRVVSAIRAIGCPAHVSDRCDAAPADLVVALVDDYLTPELAAVNDRRLRDGGQWLVARATGQEVWFGPRFVPGDTGCWRCLADRLAGNRPIERFVAAQLGRPYPMSPAVGLLPGADGLVAAMVTAEVLAIAGGHTPGVVGRLRTMPLTDFVPSDHPLPRPAHCAACGDPRAIRPDPHSVAERIRASSPARTGGRMLSASDLNERLKDVVDPILGVVTELRPVDRGPDASGYSFTASHDFPMLGRSLPQLRRNLRGQSGGRGGTVEAARAGATCEAVERYCGMWVDGTPSVRSSWAALDVRAVHPNDIMLYSDAQYTGRPAGNPDPVNTLQRVPERFDEDRPVSFTAGWSLTAAEPVLIPAALAWYGHPDLREHSYAATDSNGCAAGGSLAEAVLYGLCELYERDAVGIWWYNRLHRPGLDLTGVDDPYISRLRETYARNDRDFWVLDISTDLAMPCYVAVSRRRHEAQDVVFGFGAHPDPLTAVRGALAEMDQMIPMIWNRHADGSTRYATKDPAALAWLRNVNCESESWLTPRGEVAVADGPTAPGDLIDLYVEDLRRAGIETIVVDQTRPDIPLHVARVIAPGLRHFWRRLAPGRLYEVPVARRWRRQPTPEAELNTWNIFI